MGGLEYIDKDKAYVIGPSQTFSSKNIKKKESYKRCFWKKERYKKQYFKKEIVINALHRLGHRNQLLLK